MTFWPSSKWVWMFTLVSICQAAAVLALEGYVFVRFQDDVNDNAGHERAVTVITTFFALYIFAFVYQLILAWDALRQKNTIQIIGLVGLNIGLLIYGAVQGEQLHDTIEELKKDNEIVAGTWDATKPFVIAIPSILAAFTIALGWTAYKLYNEFAWTIYKHISADLRMKRRYLTYQIYIALLKFDFFFCLGFLIQFVIIVRGRSDAERWTTAAAIPVAMAIMFAAFWFCRRENLIGTVTVIVLYFGALAYFCFKLVRMYQKEKLAPYLPARKELTTFAVLTIGLLICTIIVACMCAHNYGKGLKPYVLNQSTKATTTPSRPEFGDIHGPANPYQQPTVYNMTTEPYKPQLGGRQAGRMEID